MFRRWPTATLVCGGVLLALLGAGPRAALAQTATPTVTPTPTVVPTMPPFLSPQEGSCLLKRNKLALQMAKTHTKEVLRCLKEGSNGALSTGIDDCLLTDPTGVLSKKELFFIKKYQDPHCELLFLPFGVNNGGLAFDVMGLKERAIAKRIFGPVLDEVIVAPDENLGKHFVGNYLVRDLTPILEAQKAARDCQLAVAKAVYKCEDAKLKQFLKCKKDWVYNQGKVANLPPLAEECLMTRDPDSDLPDPKTGQPDPNGKIAKACGPDGAILTTLSKKCAADDLQHAFPACASDRALGSDPDQLELSDVQHCLDRSVECGVCVALNELDGLERDCDLFDDHEQNLTCVADAFLCDDGHACTDDRVVTYDIPELDIEMEPAQAPPPQKGCEHVWRRWDSAPWDSPVKWCCEDASDCDDNDLCTEDHCEAESKMCVAGANYGNACTSHGECPGGLCDYACSFAAVDPLKCGEDAVSPEPQASPIPCLHSNRGRERQMCDILPCTQSEPEEECCSPPGSTDGQVCPPGPLGMLGTCYSPPGRSCNSDDDCDPPRPGDESDYGCNSPYGLADSHLHLFYEHAFGHRWLKGRVTDPFFTYRQCDGGVSHGRLMTLSPLIYAIQDTCDPLDLYDDVLRLSKKATDIPRIIFTTGSDDSRARIVSNRYSAVEGTAGDTGRHFDRAEYPYGWPRWDTWAHLRAHQSDLYEAYRGGLRLAVVTVGGFRPFAKLLPDWNHEYPEADMIDVDRQLTEAWDFVDTTKNPYNWFVEIATSPTQALQIIRDRKHLALVLAIETTELFECLTPEVLEGTGLGCPQHAALDACAGYPQGCELFALDTPQGDADAVKQGIRAAVKYYKDRGVQSIQLTHETNNRFAGAALHAPVFQLFQAAQHTCDIEESSCSEPEATCHIDEDTCSDPVIGYEVYSEWDPYSATDVCKNQVGLTEYGRVLVEEMMNQQMLPDAAHLSEVGVADLYELLRANRYYPFFVSHTRFREMMPPGDANEYAIPAWVVQRLRRTGGIAGPLPSDEEVRSYTRPGNTQPDVENSCSGSSRSFVQMYQFGLHGLKVPMALGSDINSFAHQTRPRFPSEKGDRGGHRKLPGKPNRNPNGACSAGFKAEGICQARRQKAMITSSGNRDFDIKGLAHVGLESDLLRDMFNLDPQGWWDDFAQIQYGSVVPFIRMWRRATGDDPRVGPAALANSIDTDPVDGMDLSGIGPYFGFRDADRPYSPDWDIQCFKPTRICKDSSAEGEECKATSECMNSARGMHCSGLTSCSGPGKCVCQKGSKDNNYEDSGCAKHCRSGPVVGPECGDDKPLCDPPSSCVSDMYCDLNLPLFEEDNRCVEKRGKGGKCHAHRQCMEGLCCRGRNIFGGGGECKEKTDPSKSCKEQ